MGEKVERQEQLIHALGGGDIVEMVLAARYDLGDKRDGGVAGDEIVDQRIQAAMADRADGAGRRGIV